MNLFELQQGSSRELQLFPHIISTGCRKNSAIHLESFRETVADYFRIYNIIDGKYEWRIDDERFQLYPGDTVLVLPGRKLGSPKGFLEIGALGWLHFTIDRLDHERFVPGKWSSLNESECYTMGNILLLNRTVAPSKTCEASRILASLQNELLSQGIAFNTRVNQLMDELLVAITRELAKEANPGRDFSKIFFQLEQKLRDNLARQWSVEEMAATVGMGTTLFNVRVKSYTGFTPTNYLINLRIAEAIKLLRKEDLNLTDIALDTGFCSSQHFSTTFKKLTGYTPSEFRRRKTGDS
ncbi:helix-turn-helix domain-containing protein [Puia sp. P3]|uniref:helix-turn-helix domain-containing protein n=1 Tax=Puia sp. P3 TaxID=3423952 RepID=UPI003D66CE7F